MSKQASEYSGPPERHCFARKRPKTKYALKSATKRESIPLKSMKKATAYLAIWASPIGFSRLPSGAMLSRDSGTVCRYCHGNAPAVRTCIPLWTERARTELLLRLGWDQKLLETFEDIINSLEHFLEHLILPRTIKEPPPLILLFGCCATMTFAITYLRHTNRRDRYQDKIIAGSLFAAMLVGFMSDDCPIQAMTLIPWAVMLGLVLSELVHRVLGLRAEENESGSRWLYRRKEQSAWSEDGENRDMIKHAI